MNKYLFLGNLQSLLEKQLDQDEVQRVMDYYENYIIEAVEYGKAENEVLEELGNVENLSETIVNNLKAEKDVIIKDTSDEKEEKVGDPSFSEMYDDLKKSTAKTIEDSVKIADKAAEKIAEYFTDLFSNETFFEDSEHLAGNMDVMGEFEDELQLEVQPYSDVHIKLANMSIKAYFSDDEKMQVMVPGNQESNVLLEVSHDEHTLMIREKKARVYSVFSSAHRCVEVYLPLSYKGKVYFDCSNAKIQLKGKQKKYPSPIVIQCDNGSVEIKDAILGVLEVQCDNGRIELKRVLAYKAMLNCCNGMIRYDMLKNEYAKNLFLQAKNGLIKMNNERWALSRVQHSIPARNDSKYELSVHAKCDNGVIRLTGF